MPAQMGSTGYCSLSTLTALTQMDSTGYFSVHLFVDADGFNADR